MKKRYSILGLLLCVSLLTMGCQKTPEEKAVIQKNTSALLEKEAANTTLITDYPATYADAHEKDNVSCNYDVTFHTMDAKKLPIYRVSYDTFSQDQATDFLEKTLDGKDLYEMPTEWTKDEYDGAIKSLKEQIELTGCGDNTFDGIHTYSQMLDKYKEEYKKAPEPTHEKTSLEFIKGEDGGERIFGYTMNEDGSKKVVQVSNNDYVNDSLHPTHMGFINLYDDVNSYVDFDGIFQGANNIKKMNLDLSEEDARKQAEDLIEEYGIEGFEWDEMARVVASGSPSSINNSDLTQEHKVPCAYCFNFTRKVDGIPLSTPESVTDLIQPFRTEVQSKEEQQIADDMGDDMGYSASKDCECITILVNDKGIVLFDYCAPFKIAEEVVADAHILTCEELFKSINASVDLNAGDDSSKSSMNVADSFLNYQRIDEENADASSLLVPVWSIRGSSKSEFTYEEDGKTKTEKSEDLNARLWTINAIDGSQLVTSNMLG